MSIFKDVKGKFSTKKTMNIIVFAMVVVTWILGVMNVTMPAWVSNFVLGVCATSFAQYTYGKKVDGGK
jgi:hypothetical protein